MKRIYIPTSTLNFNNIFSTESISPKIFYQNRGFGYKRFELVKPNPFEDRILGYSQLPVFSIEQSDYDDYPMVIEVDADLLNTKEVLTTRGDNVDVYEIFKTIYLVPGKTKIHFFDPNTLRTTLIVSERSLETKVVDLYKNSFVIANRDLSFNWSNAYLSKVKPSVSKDNSTSIAFDQKINRLKGLFYSYVVGVTLSSSYRDNELNLLQRKYQQLMSLLRLNDTSKSEETDSLWKNICSDTEKQIADKGFSINHFSISNLKLTSLVDSSFQGNGAEVFRNIVNMLMDFPIANTENFKESKADIAFEIGKILKEQIRNWDGSNEQAYINGLLANIESYEPFELKSHKSSLMQSISAFVMKGDDPEKLNSFLNDNNILNKRIAIGFWGSLFGFANMPKTLFYQLFNNENKKLAIESYCYLHQQIHGIKIEPFNYEHKSNVIVQPEKVVKQENKESKAITKSPKSTQKESKIEGKLPNCPKCGNQMVLRTHKKGDFYGCPDYSKGCSGKRDMQLNELDDSFKVISKSVVSVDKSDYVVMIIEYLKVVEQCKIADLNKYLKEQNSKWSHSVKTAKDYILNNMPEKVELIKIDKNGRIGKKGSEGVKLRKENLFPNS
ncbi:MULTISPECIES: hypothetical protein [unclassified Carboxylicivirga]|uniref:hypothetical protein n=1 Tax=Carboxylicivirga TaxID=1628153 RepID=UPI003D34E3B2